MTFLRLDSSQALFSDKMIPRSPPRCKQKPPPCRSGGLTFMPAPVIIQVERSAATSGFWLYAGVLELCFSANAKLKRAQEPSLGRVAVLELLEDEPQGVTTEVDNNRYVFHPQSPPFKRRPKTACRMCSASPPLAWEYILSQRAKRRQQKPP